MYSPRLSRQIFCAIIASFSLLSLGCGRKNEAPPTTAKRPEIALVMKSLANEFFKTMADGAKAHQATHSADYTLIVNGIKNETDLSQQVTLVEQMMARGVDAIVIAPADSKALIPVLQRAKAAGVLVINIDNRLDAVAMGQAGLSIPFVGPDNRAGARAVGEVLAAKLSASASVAIIEGVPNAFNSERPAKPISGTRRNSLRERQHGLGRRRRRRRRRAPGS